MIFEQAGYQNTDAVLKHAFDRAKQENIHYLVIASVKGTTIKKALELNTDIGLQLICVTHQVGFSEAGKSEMEESIKSELQKKGVKILTTTHLLGGVNRSLRREFQGIYPSEIIANTLRMFGQGTKVGIEISVMALDAGLIPYGEDIIAVGGTARGADTALILRPAHADYIFCTRIREIICMPRSDKKKE